MLRRIMIQVARQANPGFHNLPARKGKDLAQKRGIKKDGESKVALWREIRIFCVQGLGESITEVERYLASFTYSSGL